MVIELPRVTAGDDDHVDLECDGDGGSGKMKYLRGSSQVVLFVRLCIAKHVALKTGRSVGAVALGFPLKGSIRVPFKGVYKDYYKGSIRVL